MTHTHLTRLTLIVLALLTVAPAFSQSDKRLYMRRAATLAGKQQLDDAVTYYKKSLELDSANARAHYNLGNTYLAQRGAYLSQRNMALAQRYDSTALDEFKTAQRLETNSFFKSAVCHNMGVIMQARHQFKEAIEYYKEALRNYPVDHRTRYNLALCQYQLKNQPQEEPDQGQDDQQDQDEKEQPQQNEPQQEKQQQNDQSQHKDKSDMSQQNADQMLRAAQMQEKRTQEKLQKAQHRPFRRALDKNW